jgi:hypothetical protein
MLGDRCLFCGDPAMTPEHMQFCAGGAGQAAAVPPAPPAFDGETFEPARDADRLNAQLGRVLATMRDHDWHTLAELAARTTDPEASISARIRDLRKPKFGGYVVQRRYVEAGLWAYRIAPPEGALPMTGGR